MNGNYELENPDITPEETDDAPPSAEKLKKGIRFTRMLILLVMSVCAIVILFINKDKINLDNFKRLAAKIDLGISATDEVDGAVIDFDYNAGGKVDVYKDGIVRVTDDNLVILDNIGTQFQSVLTGYSNPQLITGARYVCAYDRGGKRLMVAESFDVVFERTFKDNIVDVSMNDSGCLVVVTESEAYKNHVIVFDSSFKEVYKVNSLTRYVVTADISPDGKRIVLSSLYSKGDKMLPQLNCYEISKKDMLWSCELSDSIAVNVCIKEDGSTLALFEWGVCILDKDGKEKYRHELDDSILQQYAFDDGKYNALVTSASHSGVSLLTVFDNNGKKQSETQLDFAVISADIHSDRVALLSSSEVCVYTKNGKCVSKRDTGGTETYVLFQDSDSVVTVSASHAVHNIMK